MKTSFRCCGALFGVEIWWSNGKVYEHGKDTCHNLFLHCALFLRLKMYAFWNEESRLASDTLGRLTQLLAVLYSTGTERQFLYHSTNLLLELTSRSPDFSRSIFDSPLSECKFEVRTNTADHLTEQCALRMPRYQALDIELEYSWIPSF